MVIEVFGFYPRRNCKRRGSGADGVGQVSTCKRSQLGEVMKGLRK